MRILVTTVYFACLKIPFHRRLIIVHLLINDSNIIAGSLILRILLNALLKPLYRLRMIAMAYFPNFISYSNVSGEHISEILQCFYSHLRISFIFSDNKQPELVVTLNG